MSSKTIEALKEAAAKLFDLPKVDDKRIQSCLYALGFRQTCGRCGGTGQYSYNQIHGTVCYGCGGKKNVAVKLTRKVLDDARVKVDAGDLVRAREASAKKLAARRSIAGLVAKAREVYEIIGNTYTVEGRKEKDAGILIQSPIYFAQTMNNSIYWDFIERIDADVEHGYRKDYERCVEQIIEATELLVILRDEWLRFRGE
jgi:hypothetical protein